MYIIKHPKMSINILHNQMWKRYSEDINNEKVEPMKVVYDLFDIPLTLVGETFE